ncbi:MAG: hypothetical protein AB8B86_13740 [Pseudomonadales bacterium]
MNKRAAICLLGTWFWQQHAWAHSTVSELAELSLEDLLEIRVEDQQGNVGSMKEQKKWSLNFGVYSQRLGGYRSGSRNVANDYVLVMSGEPRLETNYPVLATEIEQTVLTASMSYQLSERDTLSLTVPYVRQKTDHMSVIEDYSSFTIDTEGVGDVGMSWRNQFYRDAICQFSAGVGVSLPTGSIDEWGDTPRAPGDQQLPYTMQLGSGTYDAKFNLGMSWYFASWTWVTDAAYVRRLGTNDRNYKLGNRFTIATTWHRALGDKLKLELGGAYQTSGAISGSDREIEMPGPFPYPASITDPANFGGDIARLRARLTYQLSESQSISAGYDDPLYQHLNGVQPKAKGRFLFNWMIEF